MELGRHIKEHRTRLSMSQEQLAEAIFVSRQTISNWETGRTYPDVQSLLLLSGLFKVSVDSLIKGDVKEMKETLTNEAKRFNKLGAIMLVFGVGTIAWVLLSSWANLSLPMISVPGIVLFIPAAVSAGLAEKIKSDNKLYTYRAIDAFMRGEAFDVESEENRKAGKAWPIKLVAKMVVAAIVGLCFGWGLYSILGRIIG